MTNPNSLELVLLALIIGLAVTGAVYWALTRLVEKFHERRRYCMWRFVCDCGDTFSGTQGEVIDAAIQHHNWHEREDAK